MVRFVTGVLRKPFDDFLKFVEIQEKAKPKSQDFRNLNNNTSKPRFLNGCSTRYTDFCPGEWKNMGPRIVLNPSPSLLGFNLLRGSLEKHPEFPQVDSSFPPKPAGEQLGAPVLGTLLKQTIWATGRVFRAAMPWVSCKPSSGDYPHANSQGNTASALSIAEASTGVVEIDLLSWKSLYCAKAGEKSRKCLPDNRAFLQRSERT